MLKNEVAKLRRSDVSKGDVNGIGMMSSLLKREACWSALRGESGSDMDLLDVEAVREQSERVQRLAVSPELSLEVYTSDTAVREELKERLWVPTTGFIYDTESMNLGGTHQLIQSCVS